VEEWWSFSNAVPHKANLQRMQEQISTRDVVLVLVKLFQAFLAPAGHGVASASVQPVATWLHGLRRQW